MSARVILPQAVYRRAREPHQLGKDLRLIALEWALYFGVTGTHTAAELGRQLRAGAGERDDALARLSSLGLIEEQQLDATEYLQALAASGDREEKSLHEFLMGAVPERAGRPGGGALDPPPGASGAAPAPARPQLREVPAATNVQPRAVLRPPRQAPPLEFKPLPMLKERKENHSMAASRKLSLRAVMTLIETQAGSPEAGQLDIYRVFVRVDTLLLKRSGIETLRFTEDRLVSDPELEQAIVRSVKKTLNLDCPESVWVNVA